MELSGNTISIGRIRPNPDNPRIIKDEKFKKLCKSLKDFPEMMAKRPIVVDENWVILGGNMRWRALKENGMKTIPVEWVSIAEGWTEEQKREFVVKDNAGFGEWDWDALANWDVPLEDWGVDVPEWGADGGGSSSAEAKEDDFDESEATEGRCSKGDIWQLGNHRLMCGDSTNAADVALLMDGGKADICITDPPYGISVVTKKEGIRTGVGGGGELHFRTGIRGGNIVDGNNYAPVIGDETTETARKSYDVMKMFSGNQIIFGGNYFTDFLPPSRCWIVWDKQNGGNDFADFEMAWCSYDKSARLFPYLWNGLAREGARDIEGIRRVHPTQKPVGLLVNIVERMNLDGDSILDLFGGSGSTLIAAEQLNRKCYMMELDPHYCDVILSRWEKLTGQEAVKIE